MKANRIALITGASSGLGMSFARRFAEMGYDLIITGRNQDKLSALAGELQSASGINVQCIIAELSEEKDVNNILQVIDEVGSISVLVNNAGYGSGQEFCSCSLGTHMQMLSVHVVASLKLMYAVLPGMIRSQGGTIINVSSLGAFTPAPGNSMYSATKIFLKSFTESLHMEVSRYGIKLQCLCPGFTNTEFHNRRAEGNVRKTSGLFWMEADEVVDECLRSLEKNKIVCVPGIFNRILRYIVSLLPDKIYYRLMAAVTEKKKSQKELPVKGSVDIQPAL
jgi:short-subunit dehydrogenase